MDSAGTCPSTKYRPTTAVWQLRRNGGTPRRSLRETSSRVACARTLYPARRRQAAYSPQPPRSVPGTLPPPLPQAAARPQVGFPPHPQGHGHRCCRTPHRPAPALPACAQMRTLHPCSPRAHVPLSPPAPSCRPTRALHGAQYRVSTRRYASASEPRRAITRSSMRLGAMTSPQLRQRARGSWYTTGRPFRISPTMSALRTRMAPRSCSGHTGIHARQPTHRVGSHHSTASVSCWNARAEVGYAAAHIPQRCPHRAGFPPPPRVSRGVRLHPAPPHPPSAPRAPTGPAGRFRTAPPRRGPAEMDPHPPGWQEQACGVRPLLCQAKRPQKPTAQIHPVGCGVIRGSERRTHTGPPAPRHSSP